MEQIENTLVHLLFKMERALRHGEVAFSKQHQLSWAQCRIILLVYQKKQVELSFFTSYFKVNKSTTTKLVRPLITKGYLEKFHHFGEGRKIHLRLSEQGLQIIPAIEQYLKQKAENILRHIPMGKREYVLQVLGEFATAMESGLL